MKTKRIRWPLLNKSASLQRAKVSKICVLGFLALTRCVTPSKPSLPVGETAGWSGQARIEDKIKNNSHTVSLEFIAQRDKSLRMDVTGGPGIYLASLVVRRDEVQCLLARERKFYAGPVSDIALKPVLGVNLHPIVLQSLLFETDPPPNEWKCERDNQSLLQNCVSADGQFQIIWQNRNGGSKTIAINSPKVSMILRLGAPNSDVRLTERTFQLTAPTGYKQLKL